MNLHIYLQTRTTQTAFAKALGVSQGLVTQWVAGKTRITEKRAVQIEKFTGREVTRQELRPKDWHLIWPELATQPPQSGQIAPSFLEPNQETPKCV